RLGDGRKTGCAQKSFDRLFRRIGARPLAFLAHIAGAGGDATDIERQAARRPVFAGRLVSEARFHQTVGYELLQIARSPALHAGGNLFAAKFKKKVGHWAGSSPSPRWGGSPPDSGGGVGCY